MQFFARSFAWKVGRIIPPGFETRGIDPPYPPGSDAYACPSGNYHSVQSVYLSQLRVVAYLSNVS